MCKPAHLRDCGETAGDLAGLELLGSARQMVRDGVQVAEGDL